MSFSPNSLFYTDGYKIGAGSADSGGDPSVRDAPVF
ncbi:MAG: hypothetical protein RL059_975 [Bacteroidota bacterium]